MRRSRRPRLHISNGPGIVDFDLPAERLIELGSAIGHTLNEDDAD
jgi:hypothetical protein